MSVLTSEGRLLTVLDVGRVQEEIRDLLVHEPENLRPTVTVREAQGGGVCLAGAQEQEVTRYAEMAQVLEQGSLARATASTSMNAHSSRSHAIFTITLEQRKRSKGAATAQASAAPTEDEVHRADLHHQAGPLLQNAQEPGVYP